MATNDLKYMEEIMRRTNETVSSEYESQIIYTDINTGLLRHEIAEREDAGLLNENVDTPSKTIPQIIANNIFTYFNFVFALLALLLIFVGSFRELTFLPVIILNTLIGIIQEIRSKRVLDKLSIMNAPKVRVLRDGQISIIECEKLVVDDIVIFDAGNQICADGIVVDGEVNVNESLLTGEADEITKKSGDALMSGSFVVSGRCMTQLTTVGKNSYISKLMIEAKAEKKGERSEMIRSLNRLIAIVGIVIIPIGVIMFCQHYFKLGETLSQSVVSMVAALIGMIPEGLYLLASVAMVLSVMRLAKKRVLVHELSCIETLARVNVLCVDKTGTITENNMKIDELIELDEYIFGENEPSAEILLGDFAANMNEDNATMAAIKERFTENSGAQADSIISFSSATKYSAAIFGEDAYVLGAPEFILRGRYEEYKEQIENYSKRGQRVLVFAKYDDIPDGSALTEDVTALCLVIASNPIRKDAKKTFEYFDEQGVEIKVISGDNPLTVSEVAKRAGIKNCENYIDASTLVTEEQINEAVMKYTVFGRVTPQQKKQFVLALKKAGKTVAMTGDGVNDVLALKKADCSIAMASGSEAATHVSQLVLLDSDFACMPSVVLEGRRVVNNIERSASLFLVKNIFSMMMALFSMIFVINYPLLPSQISLVSMFTIGVPAFFLALEPNKNIIKGKFLPNVLGAAMPAGLTGFIIVAALMLFAQVFGVSETDMSTVSALLLSTVGMLFLYRMSKPMNVLRWCIWGAMLAGLIFSSIFLNDLFGITPLSLKASMLLGVFIIATEPVLRYMTKLFYALYKLHNIIIKSLSKLSRRKKQA